jgi:Signal transduction histidine kinase
VKYRSVALVASFAACYLAALAILALQIDKRNFQDQHVRSMQVEALLRGLTLESFESVEAIPRVFTWQRALLLDDRRSILSDTGWLENDSLSSGGSGSIFARRSAELGGLERPPDVDERRLALLLREAPASGYFGLVNPRVIGSGRAVYRGGKSYGIALLVDKRDLIAAKHLDHVLLLASFFLVFLLPAVLVAFVFFRLALPLDRLASAVQGLGLRERDGEIKLPGESRADEIGLVSSAFGAALREARRSEEALARFVEDALHELKNPVASLRSRLELTRLKGILSDGAYALAPEELERLLFELGRTERLVAGLGTLSAADSQDVTGTAGPASLLSKLAEGYADLGKPLALALNLPADATIAMAPEAFGRVVRVLVDNALDFSPPGTIPEIRAWATESYALVRVSDRGPGVPPNLREWIFGRFASTRKDGPESHSGLGLAIARSLVSRIGSGESRASIEVEDNPGGGAAFVIRLPMAGR